MKDCEPPFSLIEVLDFCKLNNWVFAPPLPMGGILIEQMAWCYLLVGNLVVCIGEGWGCPLGVMVFTDLYSKLMLSGSAERPFWRGTMVLSCACDLVTPCFGGGLW